MRRKSAKPLYSRFASLKVIPVGNSLTFGSYTTTPTTDKYPAKLQAMLDPFGAVVWQDGGNPGWQWSQLTASSIGFSQFDVAKLNVYLLWEGTNSIYFGRTGLQAFADCQAYCAALKAAHPLVKIVVLTTIPYYGARQGNSITQGEIDAISVEHVAYNNLIKTQGRPLIDGYIDLRIEGSPFSSTYFPDNTIGRFAAQVPPYLTSGSDASAGIYVHLSTVGQQMVADIVFNRLRMLQI